MESINEYISFWPNISEQGLELKDDLMFIIKGNEILVQEGASKLPSREQCKSLDLKEALYMGRLKKQGCYALEVEEALEMDGLEWCHLGNENWVSEEDLYFAAIKASQLLGWHRQTRFCGKCGSPLILKKDERAKLCPECGTTQYPRISPAIIVGIQKEGELLMAHNASFREGLYGIIAGFVEQGETLEQAVKREAYEEVGLRIKNIRYFSSRPWHGGDSLMIGFLADYESGEIKIDGKEITHADWYSKDKLPPILPTKLTSARAIIDYLLDLE